MWATILVIWVAFVGWEFIWLLCSALSIQDTETTVMFWGASVLGLAAAIAGTVYVAIH